MANSTIIQDKAHPLNIYRASAGSGKTHLLTGFYLKLLFTEDALPENHNGRMKFSEILAVTFTNKATAEMKTRIIKELDTLCHAPRESHYWEDLSLGGKRTEQEVSLRASDLLSQILNDYSAFNISTIDSFFQRIVRSFARELNLPGNYEVQLDVKHVLEEAVSTFLNNLDKVENSQVLAWMENYVTRRMEDGASWDFRQELTSVALKVLTSEAYRQHSQQIQEFTNDKKRMTEYVKKLWKTIKDWRNELKKIGEEGCKLLSNYGLSAKDFARGESGPMSYFGIWARGEVKEPTATFVKWADDPSAWFTKKSPYATTTPLPQTTTDAIQDQLQKAVDHTTGTPHCDYMTALAITRHFYELGIMANIDRLVIDYCNEQNVMLLNSTTDLLASLISDESTPFIYEKTGTRIHSYMIDEFQDTSAMQWNNFQPLVSEALANGYQNLIVGDVKQSIYRWRGGDWNLLHSQIGQYEKNAHHDDDTTLRINWRSRPAIVDFNNDFFPYLSQKLDERISSVNIAKIYSDVKQDKPTPKPAKTLEEEAYNKFEGLLDIRFLRPKDETGNPIAKPSNAELILEAQRQLPEVIIKLRQNGYRAKDIGILCRRNEECRWVAEGLLRYKEEHPDCPYPMDIISNEALTIANRPTVKALLCLLRHMLHPDNSLHQALAWSTYYQLEGSSPEEAFSRYCSMSEEKRIFHPELKQKPLYELCEELINLLPATERKNDAPFLQAFRDIVLEYAHSKGPNLPGFLEYWEENCQEKSISIPEGQDAMVIMSVHKSKGLGMPAVIMPFASWCLDLNTKFEEIVWCEPKEGPFKENILVPIALKNELESTIFADVFKNEREKTVIDSLNTAYVAFTRAKEAMIIMSPVSTVSKEKRGRMLEDWIEDYCLSKNAPDGFTSGQWERVLPPSKKNKKETAETTHEKLPEAETSMDIQNVTALPAITILHEPDKPDVTTKERGTYIHNVLQEIRWIEQADDAITRLYARGDIDPKVIDDVEMREVIHRMLNNPTVKTWFDPGLRVMNEQNLVDSEGKLLRADRIIIDQEGRATIIDYKTGSGHKSYFEQIRNYMNILKQVGFSQVSGYLFFIQSEKVVQVNP